MARTVLTLGRAALAAAVVVFANAAAPVSAAPAQTAALAPTAHADGVIRIKSAYPLDETVTRLKADIEKARAAKP